MPKAFHDYVWEVCFDHAFEARNTWRAAKDFVLLQISTTPPVEY